METGPCIQIFGCVVNIYTFSIYIFQRKKEKKGKRKKKKQKQKNHPAEIGCVWMANRFECLSNVRFNFASIPKTILQYFFISRFVDCNVVGTF